MRPISAILLGVIALVGLLFILSTATNDWLSKDGVSFGLWKYCGLYGNSLCETYTPTGEGDFITACRAFMIIAVIAQGCMGVVALVRLIKGGTPLLIIVILTGLAATGSAIIGLAVFAVKWVDIAPAAKDIPFGWSFYFGCGGVAVNIIAVILTLALDRSPPQHERFF